MSSSYANPLPYNTNPAGPSSHRRRPSRGAYGFGPPLYGSSDAIQEETDRDRFDDAMLDGGHHAVEPRTERPAAYHPPKSAPLRQELSTPLSLSPENELLTPSRDLLISSASVSSMSSALKGRRAPAPAALDLSPRAERSMQEQVEQGRYGTVGGLGHVRSTSDSRRVVTDTNVDRSTSHRLSRPLPVVPNSRASSIGQPQSAYQAYFAQDFMPSARRISSTLSPSPDFASPAVPLSAVGTGPPLHRNGVSDDSRPSDSYSQKSPPNPLRDQLSPSDHVSPVFPTSSPDVDPSNIDRRTLIGVGELATPRWGAQSGRGHQRTPSLPHDFGTSPPLPEPATSAPTYSNRNWSQGQSGLGLGVGVEGSKKKSSRDANKAQPNHPLLSLNTLADFEFDSTMTAALAASLSVPNQLPASPRIPREHRASAPPTQSRPSDVSASSDTSSTRTLPLQQHSWNPQPESFTVSPGSARSRIYARRQSRQSMVQPPDQPQIVPARASSKHSPPNSAESQSSALRRKRPSSRDRDSLKSRQSPNASHEILKHFTPRDFSHLPPSPSSASINQFLRGSGSVNNFSSMGTPPGGISSTSYFSGSSKGSISLQRSNSGTVRSLSQKSGWEGKEVDPDTTEALRKLDGLSSTPGKSRMPRGKLSIGALSISSRPGTPPPGKGKSEKRHSGKPTTPKGDESPLNNWVDLADDIPDVPLAAGRPSKISIGSLNRAEKRASSSSTSYVGTPTSRDSQSLPTTSTTPSSSGANKTGRRASGGSDISARSEATPPAEAMADGTEPSVPPVPPLPKGYVSMRQGMTTSSFAASDASSPTVHSPSSTESKPKQMNKKWSFSSALNLRLHNKEPSVSPVTSPIVQIDSHTPWSDIERPIISPSLARQDSTDGSQSRPVDGNRSAQSVTPVATTSSAPLPKAVTASSKRLTPSSIPFFRRTSSNSVIQQPESAPPTAIPPPSTQRNASGSVVRKSVLGMSIPSMLRNVSSRRTVSQQVIPPPTVDVVAEPTQAATTGWAGRKRGKTMSISNNIPGKLSAPPAQVVQSLKSQASADISLRSSHSIRSDSTAQASLNGRLPSIADSPALRHPQSTSSLRTSESPRDLPSITPTKIPRMTRLAGSPARGSMPPPAYPLTTSKSGTVVPSRTILSTSSGVISEFGTLNGTYATPRLSSSGAHRAHLLAPMSARSEYKRSKEPLARQVSGTVMPAPRRNLPMPPTSTTVTAPTASSIAKRASREFRPSVGRLSTSNSRQESALEKESPMKPSKSLHAKLVVPSSSRLPPSSSVGAPGVGYRKSSLLPESPSVSPTEDDEVQADNEMQTYVKRRQARRARGDKHEDLVDINGFPEDITATEPVTQRAFISKQLAQMSEYERQEVLDFDLIYYTPSTKISRPALDAVYNHGYDDERGDYHVVQGDHLCYRYEVVRILGKGSFGQVVQCRDHKTGGSVAVKIIRNKHRFHSQALVEVKILQQLVEWDPSDKHYMVRMTNSFYFRGHLCIVTELLSINLFELIKANQFAGFSTVLIRRFTSQMLASLQLMRSNRIVHCDLKPENILLRHPCKSGLKVIDFGSSCHETEKVYTYVQSRFYRSPEVILGMSYGMAIDMWSLGCILAELYTGVPIFPGENEHEQLACIMEVLGIPDRYIIDKASRHKLFFDSTGAPRPCVNSKGKRRRPGARTLAAALKCDDDPFVDFISKCLTWDPDKRLKPQPALRHPWMLAGRRRHAPSAPLSQLRNSRSESRDKSSKPLLISPPTPLMARTAGPMTRTARVGPGSVQLRGGTFSSQKISLG